MKTKLIKYLTLIMLLAFVLSITCVSAFAAEYDTITLLAGTYVFNTTIDNVDGLPTNVDIPFVFDLMDGDTYRTTVNTVKFLNSNANIPGVFIYFSDYLMYSSHTVGGFVGWETHYQGQSWNSVRLSTDQIVDAVLGKWFISNTNYYDVNSGLQETTLLLAGEYTLNDTLVFINGLNVIPCDLAFSLADIPYGSSNFYGLNVVTLLDENGQTNTFLALEGSPSHYIYNFDTNSYQGYAGLDFTLNIQEDTYIPTVWYDFFVENTNYLDVINGNNDDNKSIYQTIYYLLKVGVYGNDYALTSGQTFALEQLSLWLSLLVILAPIFVTLAILVRCVRL